MRQLVGRKSIVAFVLLFTIIVVTGMVNAPSSVHAETGWKTLPEKKNVPLNKEWIITFNKDVEVSSITSERIYIQDEANLMVQMTAVLVDDGNKIMVQPPEEGYRPNTSYTLFIGNEVSSAKRKLLSTPVKMPFKTGEQLDVSDVFVPREDSVDIVTYQEGVTSLPHDIVLSLEDLNYEEDRFVFKGFPKILERLSSGDMIIFPETERYPLGWSKEIIDIQYDGNQTVLTTKEPELEDVVKDIDISKALTITADDFTLDPEVYTRVLNETKTGDRRTFEVENSSDKSIGEIEVGMENGNPYIKVSNYKVIPEGKDHGPVKLGGKIQLTKPVVNLDMNGLAVNWLELDTGFQNKLNIEFETSGYDEEPFKIPLGIPILVNAYGVMGEIQLYIHWGINGKAYVEFEVVKDTYYNVGVKKENNEYISFNHSTFDLSADLLSMKGEIEGKVGIGPNVNASILQFPIGGIDITGGYKMKVAGEIEKDNVCFSLKDEFYMESTARVKVFKKTIWDVVIPFYSKPIHQKSTCSYRELTVEPIVLTRGETAELEISGLDYKWETHHLTLPDSNTTFRMEDQNIATVNYLGEVRAKSNARGGDQTFITVTYNNDRDAIVEAIVPVQIVDPLSSNEMKEMVENIGPNIREVFEKAEIVNGAYRNFSYIEEDLRKLATPDYLEELRHYYEEFMHPTVDIFLFAERVATALKFEVLESTPSKLRVKTVVPNRGLSAGANAMYTFIKENGKWLVDAVDSESFIDSPINPSVEQIHEYLQKLYSENSEYVKVDFVSSGTETIHNQPSNSYYERKYYIFTIETEWEQSVIKFSAHDGSIVMNE